MTALQRRASALENNFAYEQDIIFKAQARRNKLIALWAAALIGRKDVDAYAAELIDADVAQANGSFARLQHDFKAHGVKVLDEELQTRMSSLLREVAADLLHGR